MGVYNNNAQQQTDMNYNDRSVIRRHYNSQQSLTGFGSDINIALNYYVSDNWSLRFGYNCMYLSGIARAPDQLDFSDNISSGNRLSTHEQAIMHGFNIGFEGRW